MSEGCSWRTRTRPVGCSCMAGGELAGSPSAHGDEGACTLAASVILAWPRWELAGSPSVCWEEARKAGIRAVARTRSAYLDFYMCLAHMAYFHLEDIAETTERDCRMSDQVDYGYREEIKDLDKYFIDGSRYWYDDGCYSCLPARFQWRAARSRARSG